MKRIHDWMPNQSVIDWEKEHRKATFWPWSSAASFKKNRLNRNLIFFFFPDRQGCHFPHKGIAVNRTNQPYSDKSTLNLETLSNDSTPSTLDQPLWNLLKSDNVQLLPTQPPSPPLLARLTSCWWPWLLQRSDAVSLSITATLNCWEASQNMQMRFCIKIQSLIEHSKFLKWPD